MDVIRSRLIELLIEKSFKHSEEPAFKLSAGGASKFYVNCKNVTLTAEGMFLIGSVMFPRMPLEAKYVGGLTFGADAIANAISFFSVYTTNQVDSFSVKRKLKEHGIPTWIEGNVPKGSKVTIVDDVVTTGNSVIRAVSRARVCGLEILKIIILVDRQEGGMKRIKERCGNMPVEAIITREELMQGREISNYAKNIAMAN